MEFTFLNIFHIIFLNGVYILKQLARNLLLDIAFVSLYLLFWSSFLIITVFSLLSGLHLLVGCVDFFVLLVKLNFEYVIMHMVKTHN